jgi:hypothetical protein
MTFSIEIVKEGAISKKYAFSGRIQDAPQGEKYGEGIDPI